MRQALVCLLGTLICLWLGVAGGDLEVSAASSAEEIHAQILEGQDALYHGDFGRALDIFSILAQDFPDDPRGYFFQALTYRWLTRIDPASSDYQNHFEESSENAISVAKALLKKDKQDEAGLLYLAATYGYRAEYFDALKHSWSKAYDEGVEMREYLERAAEISNSNLDIQLGYGLYNYYAYVYREKIGWWRFLLSLPKGDKEKGIQLLHSVRERGTYAKIEAWYFLIDIYKQDAATREQALALCAALHQQYPAHPYFHILLAGLYHKKQDWKRSIRSAREVLDRAAENPYYSEYIVYQAKYLIGESSFFLGKHQDALPMFDDIIASQPELPTYLVPWAHLRRGNIYDISGQKAQAAKEYQVVLSLSDVQSVHDLAKAFLKNQKKQR